MKKLLLLSLFLMCTLLQQVMAQDRTISGTVIDRQSNTGLPGVTVLVKGTTIGTNTDINGYYSITVPAGSNTLEYRFIGYQTVERTIGTESNIDVTLATDTRQLGEVVVTALGLEKEKRSLGYATQEINSEELTQGRDRSVLNSMQGKVAGVQITSASGGVGSSTRVVIRGNKSLTGNNQPLYVIDGIPIDNSSFGTGDNLNNSVDAGNRANDINPEDVESVNVLKGPAAVALYGSRAANGAIIITTKSGRGAADRNKKAEITYTSSYMFENVLRFPEFQNRFGQGFFGEFELEENTSWGPRFDGIERPWGREVNGQQRYKPYSALPNNVKDFFETGRVFTNTIALAGGDEKTNYRLSFSDLDQKGVTPGTEYDRNTVQFSGETRLSNKFRSGASLTYTKTKSDLAVMGQGNSIFDQIIQTPRDISLLELKDHTSPFNDINGYYSQYTINPYWIINETSFRNNVDRIFGNFNVGYDFNDKLKLTYRIGTDIYTDRRSQFLPARFATGPNTARNDNGEITESRYFSREVNTDLILTYNHDLSEDLNMNVLVGHNVNQRSLDFLQATSPELATNVYQGISNIQGNYIVNGSTELRRLHGVYGTVDFGYKNYLFLGLTARNDWSSTLPVENRSFFYPAVNASFVFTDALGLEDSPFSYGKIRANWASVGNDAPTYITNRIFVSGSIDDGYSNSDFNFPFNGVAGFEVGNNITDPRLQPEITKSWEIGTDLRFFDDRINLDLSYYNSRSTEQIVSVPVSFTSGNSNYTVNAGTISNKGIEVLLSGYPIRTNNLSWEIGVNFTKNRNRVEDLFGDTKQINLGGLGSAALVARKGHEYGEFQAEVYERDPQGRIVVNAATGLPVKATEQAYVGSIQPDFLAGLTNTVTYKGFRLNVVFDTRQGGQFYSRTRGTMRFAGTAPETMYNDRQPFILPNSVVSQGDGTYTENTTVISHENQTLYRYWGELPEATNIIDASFVKLREVSLSYSIPKSITDRTPFGGIQVGISGRNLLLWTPSENTYVDPEVNTFGNGNLQGYDFTGSPSVRSYGANLRITF